MVATGIEAGAMLLSRGTVICPDALAGPEICPWLTAGAGAIRRLGIVDFRAAWRINKKYNLFR